MAENEELLLVTEKIERELISEYGHLIGSRDLPKVLGFPNAVALRQAVHRNQLPIKLFSIEHRRGKFASATDCARLLATQILGGSDHVNR